MAKTPTSTAKPKAKRQVASVVADPLSMAPVAGIPAVFCNQAHVATAITFSRITFGENFPGIGAVFRTAIVLPTVDMGNLAVALVSQLAEQGYEFSLNGVGRLEITKTP